jgi:hypothetical protein
VTVWIEMAHTIERKTKGTYQRGLGFAEEAHVEQVAADVQVEQQVAVEHEHVPGEHRHRPVEAADAGDHVPEAVGPAEVDHDESRGT